MTSITKTYLYNFDPLKPHFHIVKLGFTGVYIIFLISAQNIDYGYSLEPPRRGGSNEYPQSMFWADIWKISDFFYPKNFMFLEVKFSTFLNMRVFVMIGLFGQALLNSVDPDLTAPLEHLNHRRHSLSFRQNILNTRGSQRNLISK